MTSQPGLGDEAVRLLSAMEGWLRTASDGSADTATPDGVVRELFAGVAAHRSDSPCQICPLCQLIAAARNVRPDVVEHLAAAVGSLVVAFRALTEPPAADNEAIHPPGQHASAIVVQHIPIN